MRLAGIRTVVRPGMTLFLDAIRRRNAHPDLVPMLDRLLEANASLAGLMTGLLDLVVDDDPDVLDAKVAMLESFGCGVRTAQTAERVAALLRERVPDIVVSDHHLGEGLSGLSGLTLLQGLERSHPAIGGVLITADVSDEALRAYAAPEKPVLYKPVDLDALKQAVDDVASRRAGSAVERIGT